MVDRAVPGFPLKKNCRQFPYHKLTLHRLLHTPTDLLTLAEGCRYFHSVLKYTVDRIYIQHLQPKQYRQYYMCDLLPILFLRMLQLNLV